VKLIESAGARYLAIEAAVNEVITDYDNQNRFLDESAVDRLKPYFATYKLRARVAATIGAKWEKIVRAAGEQLFRKRPDLVCPDGNAYGTEKTAKCLRDLEYFLRYATYAMLAGDPSILDERLLNGLKETYYSLDVPMDATIEAIRGMKEVITNLVGSDATREIGTYLDYICDNLSDKSAPSFSYSDPLAHARLRGVEARERLIRVGGGQLFSSQVAQKLGIRLEQVDELRDNGKLIALTNSQGEYLYPQWQLTEQGILSGLDEVFAELDKDDPWMQISFMVNPNIWLNEASPLEMLREGKVREVLLAARASGEQGAA
jgi:allophycocyanin beta subunit